MKSRHLPVTAVALVLGGLILSPAALGQPTFVRGDANSDRTVNVADPLATLSHLFSGGDIACRDAADSNDDGALDVSDPVHTLGFLFLGGSPIPPPGPHECGPDPTIDALGQCGSPACDDDGIDPPPVEGDGPPGEFNDGIVPPFDVSNDDTESIQDLFQTGLFEDALDRVLNSPGDSITLELAASVSVPLVSVLNVNVERSFTAEISLQEKGEREVHQVAVSLETVGQLGVEIYEGLEANAGLAASGKVILEFDSITETVRALGDIAFALVIQPSFNAIDAGLIAASDAMSQAASDAEEALAGLQQKIEERGGLAGKLVNLQSQLNRLVRDLNNARGRVVDFLQGVANNFCNRFPRLPPCPKVREIQALIDRLQADRNRLVNQITSTENQLAALDAAIGAARMGLSAAEDAFATASDLFEKHQQVVNAFGGAKRNIGLAAGAVELYFGNTADLQLSALPVDTGSLSLGAELQGQSGYTVLIELGSDLLPETITVEQSAQVTLGSSVGVGVGVAGTSIARVSRTQKHGEVAGEFVTISDTVELALDLHGEVVVGAIVSTSLGAGRKLSIGFELPSPDEIISIAEALASRDFSSLRSALLGVEATFGYADRITAGAGFDFSVSVAGGGVGAKGVGTWTDVQNDLETTIGVSDVIDTVFSAAQVAARLGEVVAKVEEEASRS